MAFQQPQQRPRPARQLSIDYNNQQQHIPGPSSPARTRKVEESQEWILFSPQNDEQSISQTSRTPRTATHRTLSDIASLETHVRSHDNTHGDDSGTCLGTEVDELDSLDDGLHAFHNPFPTTPNLDQSGGTVLPTHDGFGGFPTGTSLQEHLWQFERHNPHRRTSKHARRRSSVQRRLDELEEEQEVSAEDERTARIERWRLDQSRAVLEEIERETRRRRRRLSRMTTASSAAELRHSMQESMLSRTYSRQESDIFEESETGKEGEQPQSESWWRRITRKVIQDLIGLDEHTLSVIFGEQLADEASPTPTQPSPLANAAMKESRVAFRDTQPANWEVKLLDRIARELGVLVHTLAEYDGTAFNAYRRDQEQPIEYAGLPRDIPRQPSLRQRIKLELARTGKAPVDNEFSPTLPQAPLSPLEPADTSLWGIEEEPDNLTDDEEAAKLRKEREYWERDVDVRMIFSYLKNRFTSDATKDQQPSAADSIGPLPASWATVGTSTSAMGTSPESQRRKEIIRQQHPLVSRAAERALERAKASAAAARRRESLLKRHQMETIMRKRTGSSECASQSTKRSRHTKSGSSRHYWDIGGSAGSIGSGPAMSHGLGGWGEV